MQCVITRVPAMSYFILGDDRFALPIGDTVVGGTADEALPFAELASVPPAAIVSVSPDGEATIRRVSSIPVSIDGRAVTGDPVTLVHGARVSVDLVSMVFGDLRESGKTNPIDGVSDDDLAAFVSLPTVPTSDTGGRLVRSDGTVIEIPGDGIVVGRDPSLGLVVAGKVASRRHATVRSTLQGYVVTDDSVNGTYVNGRRVDGSVLLGMGDVIRIGEEELRFEADPVPADPSADAETAQAPREPAPVMAPGVRLPLLATLEILNGGPLKGTRFRIERASVHIGRSEHSDFRLQDKSVSAAHASLTRRGDGWIVLDLRSTNGTYLNGERIKGERLLPGIAELRFGDIKTVFRPIAGSAEDEGSTRVIAGLSDDQTP